MILSRKKLGNDPRLDYMKQRCQEYKKTKWTKDVWDEELTRYFDIKEREYIEIQESMDKIIVTHENVNIMTPIIIKRIEDKKYDFKKYMHMNWDK